MIVGLISLVMAAAADPVLENPVWAHVPSQIDMDLSYPARTQEKSGYATMDCAVTDAGHLRNCRVTSETYPAEGNGFGAALYSLLPKYQLDLSPTGSRPAYGQRVRVTAFWVEPSSARLAASLPTIPVAPRTPYVLAPLSPEPPHPRPQTTVRYPIWSSVPGAEDAAKVYPRQAVDAGVGGRTTMQCAIANDLTLTDCSLVSEAPAGEGFGSAALQLVPEFSVKASDIDGAPVAGRKVFVSLSWDVPPATPRKGHISFASAPPPLPMVGSAQTPAPVVMALPTGASPARSSVITNPAWITRPDGDDFVHAYPPAALEAGVEGRSTMQCLVEGGGTLSDCRVISETPVGKGFGEAELELAPKFRMETTTIDGQPVGGAAVIIPMSWRLGDSTPPPAPAAH